MNILEKFFYVVALLQLLPLAAFVISLLVVLWTDYLHPRLQARLGQWSVRLQRQPPVRTTQGIALHPARGRTFTV